jgi:hypothetical protein
MGLIEGCKMHVPGNSGIDYAANGIELMCRIYCVQMIGRLKNLHH